MSELPLGSRDGILYKNPNRPCPDCGTIEPIAFKWKLNKARNAEIRCTRCKKCESKRETDSKIRKLMLKSQNGLCDLCHQPLEITNSHIDHNHETGVERGLLHSGCNTKLAAIEDKIFKRLAEQYLQKHENPHTI